jgi:hypothetical protein
MDYQKGCKHFIYFQRTRKESLKRVAKRGKKLFRKKVKNDLEKQRHENAWTHNYLFFVRDSS